MIPFLRNKPNPQVYINLDIFYSVCRKRIKGSKVKVTLYKSFVIRNFSNKT
jgi:hypothetical protein